MVSPSRSAAAIALVSTSSSATSMPNRPSFAATSPTGTLELFDMNPTVQPAARNAVTASAAPGIGSSPRQITPSRSQQTTGGARAPSVGSGPATIAPAPSGGVVSDACERVAVLVAGAASPPRAGGAHEHPPGRRRA